MGLPRDMPTRLKLSSLVLVLANLAPLAGVLFFDWTVSSVIVLYWFENIVLGIVNIGRMALCTRYPDPDDTQGPGLQFASKSIAIPFFVFHYLVFCIVHGVFVFSMFPDEQGIFPGASGADPFDALFRAVHIFSTPLGFAAFVLAASHVVSFFVNYIGGREFETLDLRQVMMLPYGRIVVLHLTIIFGGMATEALGGPLIALVILIAVKTAVDLGLHRREHRKAASVRDRTGAARSA
jgi:Family of unknown function (DUF6498)